MSTIRRLIAGLLLTAVGAALLAPAALADSDAPPVDTTSNNYVLVIVGIGVVVIVLLSAVALRGISRSRRARWSEREYEAQRARADEATTAHGGTGSEEAE